jgi:3-oxoacyl-[acyl-carrier protein] reductase
MNIFLTGVSGDIGSFLAKHFLENNNQVIGFDIKDFDDKLLLNNQNFKFIKCDLTNFNHVVKSYDSAQIEYGIPDVLINGAGLIFSAPIVKFSLEGEIIGHDFEKWNTVLNSSLSSTFYLTTLASKTWIQKLRPGIIINFSSISAHGNPGQSAYSAAKAGINGLTISAAKELGQYGIRCAAIAPGFINTKSTEEALSAENLRKIKKSIPLQRLGELSEIARTVDFIIENQYTTGVILEINGGVVV